jgi:hypothetical protein
MAKKPIENTISRRDQGGRFLMGNIGGPGRPKGSRNKLAQEFIDACYDSWQTHGAAALDRMATETPAKYCALMANLIPQHFKMEHEHTALVLSEEELRAKLLEIRAKLLDSDDDPDLLGPPPDGSQSSADGAKPVVKLPARRNRKTPSIN